jgi:hypothetical protein
MEPMSLLVPKTIHECILDIIEGQARKLAIDIAKTLNVNEKILIQELKKEKLEILTFDDGIDITDLCCKSFNLVKNVYVPCDEPVVYKKDYCLTHMEKHLTIDTLKNLDVLTVLNYDTIKYYRNTENVVYNSEFEPIGLYDPTTQEIIQFIKEELQ